MVDFAKYIDNILDPKIPKIKIISVITSSRVQHCSSKCGSYYDVGCIMVVSEIWEIGFKTPILSPNKTNVPVWETEILSYIIYNTTKRTNPNRSNSPTHPTCGGCNTNVVLVQILLILQPRIAGSHPWQPSGTLLLRDFANVSCSWTRKCRFGVCSLGRLTREVRGHFQDTPFKNPNPNGYFRRLL